MTEHTAAQLARATLHRLARLELPPTPENYTRIYRELAGAEGSMLSDELAYDACAELLPVAKALVAAITDKTDQLAVSMGERSREMESSVRELNRATEKEEIRQVLVGIVSIANAIRSTVEDSRADLVSTSETLKNIRVDLQQTRALLHEDHLTGAQNRRAMDAILAQEVARARAHHGKLSVIMMDIDHFKTVNDTYGHDAGDNLLSHLAFIARSVLRESDVLVRYGGEEFLLILPDSDMEGARFVIERLNQVIHKSPLIYDGKKIAVTCSAGLAELKDSENGHALILRADAVLYEAKREGRDRYKTAD
ncbi:MAG: GGDEF domain-containing protein [Betaproteobacteria bacterium]|nr:GGDEF domain-containing protein [Betaproteobacteria bacterium]